MQMVFVNTIYNSFQSALPFENGVVIYSFLYHISEAINDHYYLLSKVSRAVRRAGNKIHLMADSIPTLAQLISGANTNSYFSYHGSLSRPPCYNSITWIVNRATIPISSSQVSIDNSILYL